MSYTQLGTPFKMLLRACRTFWYQTVLCSDRGTLFIRQKLKNQFSKKSLQWSCSNQKTNTEYFHYIYRWTYHKNITALIQRTVEIYYYPLRPLKWAKTQKLAPTAHFKGYDPTFWAKRHTITSRMIPKVKKIYPKKPPCSSRSIPLKSNIFRNCMESFPIVPMTPWTLWMTPSSRITNTSRTKPLNWTENWEQFWVELLMIA